MTPTFIYQNTSEWLLLQGFVKLVPNEKDLIYFFIDVFQKVSGQLPSKKIARRLGSGFGLGLALELGLGGNFPRGQLS